MINKDHEKVQWIQILRGVAAAAVALHHSIYYVAARDGMRSAADDLTIFAAGVDLFFVISGFVMMMVSDHEAGREVTARRFIVNRIVRIVPLYWLYTLVVAVISASGFGVMRSASVSMESFILSLLFIPLRGADGAAPILTVGWTLNYEVWFYAAFATMIHLGAIARIATMATIFAALFAIGHLSSSDGEIYLYLKSSITFEFLAGMVLYVLYRHGVRHNIRHAVMLIVSAAALFAWSALQGAPAPAVRFLMWGIPAAAVVFACLSLPEIKGGAGRILVLLGDASYSIYLSHLFVIGATYVVTQHLFGLSFGAVVGICFAASLVVGIAAYLAIERPLVRTARLSVRRWLKRSA